MLDVPESQVGRVSSPHRAPDLIFSLQGGHKTSEWVSFVLLWFIDIIRMSLPSFIQKFDRMSSGEAKTCPGRFRFLVQNW